MCSKGPQNQSTTAHALAMDSKILTANRMHRRFCQCQVGKVLEKFRPKFLVSPLSENIFNELIEFINLSAIQLNLCLFSQNIYLS